MAQFAVGDKVRFNSQDRVILALGPRHPTADDEPWYILDYPGEPKTANHDNTFHAFERDIVSTG